MSAEYLESLQDSARWLFDKEQELFAREQEVEAQEERIAARETSVSHCEEYVAKREERLDEREDEVDACEKRSLALEKRINAQKSKMLDGKHLQRLNASRHEAEVEQTNAYIAQLKQELATAEREKKDMAEKLEQAAVREAELKRKLKEQGVERQKASFSSLKWI